VSKIAVVHYIGATAKSRSVVASIVADFRTHGDEVIVLDIGKFGTIFQEFPPEWALRLVGHRTFASRFGDELHLLGASEVILDSQNNSGSTPPESRQEECFQAIESELLTYFRQESLADGQRYVRWLKKALTEQALACYAAFHHWLNQNSPDLVVIPNGRTSRQKMCRVASEELGIPTKFYENGRARRDSYYLGKTQPHDRLASQHEVDELTSKLSSQEITSLAQSWLEDRMNPSSGTNTFSSGWVHNEGQQNGESPRSRAVFFSSSADEFLAFGPMWNIDRWSSQFQAFEMLMERLSEKNVDLMLRIHPNLSGKSHTYFQKTVKEIRALQGKFPALKVYWHNSRVNSYSLAQLADYVIAERSTIALEANLMGKSVWINQAAQWDLIADVRQVLEPSDIRKDDLTPWKVDVGGAEKFVAYWVTQEYPLHYSWQNWCSWNPEATPFAVKLASLLGKNPFPHKLHLIRLELARWRNNHYKV
jgi:hypothetical protein